MNEQYPPVITLPEGLSDEAAATLLEFLTELTQCFESYYAGQLHRYYHRIDAPHQDLGPEQDPPF
jgi:hypothetical protein